MLMKITFEKDGIKKIVTDNKENIKCMESAGWVLTIDKTPKIQDNPPQSQDEVEGITAQPSGNVEPVKRRGRPRG